MKLNPLTDAEKQFFLKSFSRAIYFSYIDKVSYRNGIAIKDLTEGQKSIIHEEFFRDLNHLLNIFNKNKWEIDTLNQPGYHTPKTLETQVNRFLDRELHIKSSKKSQKLLKNLSWADEAFSQVDRDFWDYVDSNP